eukprot:2798347-Rhodomonas_salina.1
MSECSFFSVSWHSSRGPSQTEQQQLDRDQNWPGNNGKQKSNGRAAARQREHTDDRIMQTDAIVFGMHPAQRSACELQLATQGPRNSFRFSLQVWSVLELSLEDANPFGISDQ